MLLLSTVFTLFVSTLVRAEISALRYTTNSCETGAVGSAAGLNATEFQIDCAFVPVPKDYWAGQKTNSTAGFYVRMQRIRQFEASNKVSTQVIVLPGIDAGSSAQTVETTALSYYHMSDRNPNIGVMEVLGLDFRGTGDSFNGMICNDRDQYREWSRNTFSLNNTQDVAYGLSACYADILSRKVHPNFYSLNNSAYDLQRIIDTLRQDNRKRNINPKIFLHGQGVGTAWVQAFMQLSPDYVDGVILESLVPTDSSIQQFGDQPLYRDNLAQSILQECTSNPVCQKMFPKTSRWTSMLDRMANSPPACSQNITILALQLVAVSWNTTVNDLQTSGMKVDTLFKILFNFLMDFGEKGIQTGFALGHALANCDCPEYDPAALASMLASTDLVRPQQVINEPRYVNRLIGFQVGFNELSTTARSAQDLRYFEATSNFIATPNGITDELKKVTIKATGVYSGVFAKNKIVATSKTSVLAFHGVLDASTHLQSARRQWDNIHNQGNAWKQLVEVSYGGAVVSNLVCVQDMIAQMLQDPSKSPDNKCKQPEKSASHFIRWDNSSDSIQKIFSIPNQNAVVSSSALTSFNTVSVMYLFAIYFI